MCRSAPAQFLERGSAHRPANPQNQREAFPVVAHFPFAEDALDQNARAMLAADRVEAQHELFRFFHLEEL